MSYAKDKFIYDLDDGSKLMVLLNKAGATVHITHIDVDGEIQYEFRVKTIECEGLATILKLVYTMGMPPEEN